MKLEYFFSLSFIIALIAGMAGFLSYVFKIEFLTVAAVCVSLFLLICFIMIFAYQIANRKK